MGAKRLTTTFLFIILAVVNHSTAAQNATGDRKALLAIKSMIQNDPQGVMTSWNDSSLNFCQWQGVTCSLRRQRVTLLDLSNGGLHGSLSPFIGNLSFLQGIQIQNNSFSGNIPVEVGRLFRLQELFLFNNSFTGNIPSSISNCTNLEVLHLGYNDLVGKIPDGIGSLTMLNVLIIHGNIFEGGIPRFIGNLTSLMYLSLGDCQLGGTIPDVFQPLDNLMRIALSGNNLTGTIPPSLYNVSTLEQLFIDNNRLTGTLPTKFGSNQPVLEIFSLSDNRFTGPLPPSILGSSVLQVLDVARNTLSGKLVITGPRNSCKFVIMSLSGNSFGSGEDDEMKFIDDLSICRGLGVLDLGYNRLRGFLPDSIGNLSTTLYFLIFASNSFWGGFPSSVGNLFNLTSLDLSNNQLTGTLPVTLGNLVNLRRLDCKNNSFSGNIPASLGNLSPLIELDLSLNSLTGNIPSSLGNCKRLIRLNLERNKLNGTIPRQLFEITSLSITLNLGSNQLSGLLVDVGILGNLNELILANNRLSGELPSSLGSYSSLQTLNVSNNFFSGSLPTWLGSLRGLENLDVSRNNFSGLIPTNLEVIPLDNLNMSFNGFEGEMLTKGVFANASSVSVVGNSRLCGGLPEFQLPKCSSTKKKNKLSLAVILVISIVSFLVCVETILFLVCYQRKRKVEYDHTTGTISGESLIQVSYETLYKATDGFSEKNFIGEGSFSSVYRGCLGKDGVNIVAIKVLNLQRRGGSRSFISECDALRNTRHRNLIKVITCCSGIDFQGNEFKAIVYEFMPNGSLDQWLHNLQHELPRLTLLQRVCIALDVAYALDYLHHQAGKTIVHCDLKPSNILLDDDMVAHVGDFGLSKILQSEYQNKHHSSSAGVRGTVGYAAPEYGLGNKVSRSADMYSYGILLLEMITSKKPTDAVFGDGLSLHNYAKTATSALEIVDPVLVHDDNGKLELRTHTEGIEETEGYMNNETCLCLLLEIGVSCSMESPQYRRDTSSVIQELLLIKDAILGNSTVFLSSV